MSISRRKIKSVYYKRNMYNVPETMVKHIDGNDTVQLDENLIVYWDEKELKWLDASDDLIEKYTNKKSIVVELNGKIYKSFISPSDIIEDENKNQVCDTFIKHKVKYDKNKNVWLMV